MNLTTQANHQRLAWLQNLYSGYFTFTMASGIISIAFSMLSLTAMATLFKIIALVSWFFMLTLYSWRLTLFPKTVLNNLLDSRTTFIFFSFVAATNIVGLLLHESGWLKLAIVCWIIAFVAWTSLLYCGFMTLTLAHQNRQANVVHGGWLITIVGTQSLVLLGAKVAPTLGQYASYMMVEIYMLWFLGLILYAIFVTLFCYRIFFLEMTMKDFSPLMWVIMGAAAITTNAGSSLALAPPTLPFLATLAGTVNSIILMSWAWATWWIPLLVGIGFWKHGIVKLPLTYDPRQWSIVFPLGMYTVASYRLGLTTEFEPLYWIAKVTIWLSVGTWLVVVGGLLINLMKAKAD